jgi:hypothetical protein
MMRLPINGEHTNADPPVIAQVPEAAADGNGAKEKLHVQRRLHLLKDHHTW